MHGQRMIPQGMMQSPGIMQGSPVSPMHAQQFAASPMASPGYNMHGVGGGVQRQGSGMQTANPGQQPPGGGGAQQQAP